MFFTVEELEKMNKKELISTILMIQAFNYHYLRLLRKEKEV